MKQDSHKNSIIEELSSLDPAFRDHGDSLYALLTTLETLKPVVAIDPNTKSTLRTNLLSTRRPIASPYHNPLSWWTINLVPVAAFAVLLIMVTTQSGGGGAQFYGGGGGLGMHGDVGVDSLSSLSPEETPSQAKSISYSSEVDTAATESADTSLAYDEPMRTLAPDVPTPTIGRGSIEIDSVSKNSIMYLTKITIDRDGFVVARDSEGAYRGVTPLIKRGISENVPLTLTTPGTEGEMFTFELRGDDGDTLYSDQDPLLVDQNGTPITTSGTVVTE